MTVDVILVDNRDEPLSASESSKILEESGAQKELQQATGLAVEIETPPATEGINPAAGIDSTILIFYSTFGSKETYSRFNMYYQ